MAVVATYYLEGADPLAVPRGLHRLTVEKVYDTVRILHDLLNQTGPTGRPSGFGAIQASDFLAPEPLGDYGSDVARNFRSVWQIFGEVALMAENSDGKVGEPVKAVEERRGNLRSEVIVEWSGLSQTIRDWWELKRYLEPWLGSEIDLSQDEQIVPRAQQGIVDACDEAVRKVRSAFYLVAAQMSDDQDLINRVSRDLADFKAPKGGGAVAGSATSSDVSGGSAPLEESSSEADSGESTGESTEADSVEDALFGGPEGPRLFPERQVDENGSESYVAAMTVQPDLGLVMNYAGTSQSPQRSEYVYTVRASDGTTWDLKAGEGSRVRKVVTVSAGRESTEYLIFSPTEITMKKYPKDEDRGLKEAVDKLAPTGTPSRRLPSSPPKEDIPR